MDMEILTDLQTNAAHVIDLVVTILQNSKPHTELLEAHKKVVKLFEY